MTAVLFALAALLVASERSPAATERELVVFAAASLREPFEDLIRQFEKARPGTRVRVSFAGSQELRLQIEQGARADLFASADERQVAPLVAAKLALPPVIFAANELVIIVPGDEPAQMRTVQDLPRARRLVIGAPEVPVGAYTRAFLQKAEADGGKGFAARVLARVVSHELNVRQVLAKVAMGEADAGIVYRTDAAAAKGRVRTIPIPAHLDVDARYPITILRGARAPAEARAFVDLLLGPSGRARLARDGFSPVTRSR